MKLSIVATLYWSAEYIDEFHRRASAVAQQLAGNSYEIVLVNDGSPDNSLDIAVRLAASDDHVVTVDLSRNFGHHKAMMTGLAQAQGDLIFLLDSDLEEEPEWLIGFAQQMERDKADVVYGVQNKRKGGWFERWSGRLFYRIFHILTGLPIPANMVTARIMSRRYVNALLQHEEREIEIGGLWYITGFKQTAQFVKKHSTSETTYSFRHKLHLFVNSITSFSNVPLIGIFYIGTAISILSGAHICFIIIQWIFLSQPVSGWTSVISSIWLLGGLIISFIGVIGIYLARVYAEVKHRPYTIIRHIYGKRDQQ